MKKLLPAIVALLGAAPLTWAGISPADVDKAAAEVQPRVVEWRRWFHQNPELSNREFKTSAKIAEILRGMGLEPRTGIAHTGLVAVIEGGLPGPLVAIRADMDGLPVDERTGLPFASTARSEYNGQDVGVMHACGHDAHMAMVLGAANILNDMKAELAGSVMLIFQPAEEGPPDGEDGGARMMLKEGIFEERMPEAVFGMHVGFVAGGHIGLKPGPLMASADSFKIHVQGRQTHGARPWGGIDPVVVAAQIVLGLQTITSRQVDVTLAPSIVSIGRISGGIRNNVIPDEVEMEGTVRAFDPDMREYIHQAIRRTAENIARSAGATATVERGRGTPALINSAELTAKMMPSLERASGDLPVIRLNPQTVAEDFSRYAMVAPAMFMFLGAGPPGSDPESLPSNHSPLFNVDEANMELGVRVFSNLVVDYLR